MCVAHLLPVGMQEQNCYKVPLLYELQQPVFSDVRNSLRFLLQFLPELPQLCMLQS